MYLCFSSPIDSNELILLALGTLIRIKIKVDAQEEIIATCLLQLALCWECV